ncbi:DNA-binding domain-containing protein [Vineibacter terrae]|uniref:DNA-binding domain-containing protein n=1 Tax=Vineibacter terrae TaxID=2586908 RepID=UPI002E343C6E|nr:DNA-binding domain-containing protein [Vineibacter terrae]HEX2888529.1 DNA-binding domain-containing protein [Vineibacter terrae]
MSAMDAGTMDVGTMDVGTMGLGALQRAFRAHLLGEAVPELVAATVSDRIPSAARLRVHRHHVLDSLAAALGATFSTVRGVVGDDFFAGMARAFITQAPPRGPVLSEYGAGFPGFVGGWPPAGGLPYLADVARLDWALTEACNAPAAPGPTAAHLAALAPEALAALPLALRAGVTLVSSAYPLDRIWALNHGGAVEGVDLDAGGVDLLVFPRAEDAAFVRLEAGVAALAAALDSGQKLGAAVEQAQGLQPGLDVGAALGRLLSLDALSAPAGNSL